MDENKGIDISKTIMDTIKLLEEKLALIKEVNIIKYTIIRKRLNEIYEASKNKQLNVFETVNLLMKLQNEIIEVLDDDAYKNQNNKASENNEQLEEEKCVEETNKEEQAKPLETETEVESNKENMQLQLYVEHKQSFWRRLWNKIVSKFSELKGNATKLEA